MADSNNTTATQGTPSPAPGTGTGTGTSGAGQGSSPFDPGMLLMFGSMAILFWLFIIRPEKKRQKEKEALTSSLKKSDKIVTIFGMYGTIVDIDGEDITLMVDQKKEVKMRIRRSAIDQVLVEEAKEARK